MMLTCPRSSIHKSDSRLVASSGEVEIGLIRFEPLLKRARWGGTRLRTVLDKNSGPENDYAESWEIADHGVDLSVVATGPLAGLTLQDLLLDHNHAILGRHAGLSQFPLLIKLLDARDRLSVQVHPDDATAKTFDPVENGKTEAWVIIDARPGSRIYAGLKNHVTADLMRSAIETGSLEDCLHSFPVSIGDCVFIPAGTVHAIADGIVLAEVQTSSDMTFRLYDWGRVGTDGRPRELHIEQAIMCTDFEVGPLACQTHQPIDGGQQLVNCNFFTIHKYSGPDEVQLPDDDRFHILMSIAGEASLIAGSNVECLKLGQTVLLPAQRKTTSINLSTNNTVLDVFLP